MAITTTEHKDLTSADAHVGGYLGSSDPGAIGAGKYWIDTTAGTGAWSLKVRNAANTGWEVIGAGASHPNLAAHDALGLATDAELTAHAAAADPHIGYQRETEKAAANGYASLDSTTKVPIAQLATGTADGTKFLRDDRTWVTPVASHPDLATHDTLGLATDAELATHAAAADPHTGYRLESADHTHASTGLQAGQIAHSALTGLTTGDPHTQYQQESEKAAASGYASLDAGTKVPIAQIPTGTSGTTVALGDAAAALDATHAAAADPHTGYRLESADHTHATTGLQGGTVAHSALTGLTTGDPHTQYQQESEKAAASGYASLDATTKVPIAQIPTGTSSSTVALGDAPAAAVTTHEAAGDPHTGYRLESADHSHASTGLQAGQVAHSALTGLTTGDPHTQYQQESEKAAASGYASLDAGTLVPVAQLGTGTPDGTKFLRDDRTWVTPAGGGGGAPTNAGYLVTVADATLSAEVVVGTTPGGELGGTWAAPTVDSVHSGSAHVTAHSALSGLSADDHPQYATDADLTAHNAAADPHTGYRLESADHTHATTGLQGGQVAHSALSGITATDHHVAPAAGPDADVTVDAAGAAGTASTFARSGHGHKVATSAAAPVTQAFGDAAAAGTSGTAPSRGDHRHGMPGAGSGMVQTIPFIIDGGGSVITTGIKGDLPIDFACTITEWRLLGDQSGSIAVAIWKDTYTNFPPVVGDLLLTPSITTATKNQATGLSHAIAAGDILRFNVNSVTSLTRVTLALEVVRT